MTGEHPNTREALSTELVNVPAQGSLHTPGPWHVRDLHPGGCTFNIGTNPNDPYDGEVAVVFRYGKHVQAPHKANALLIAAAPDLLELAKQYAMECASCDGQGTVNRQIGGDGYGGQCAAIADVEAVCQDCADIRAVIARAEGRDHG